MTWERKKRKQDKGAFPDSASFIPHICYRKTGHTNIGLRDLRLIFFFFFLIPYPSLPLAVVIFSSGPNQPQNEWSLHQTHSDQILKGSLS